MKIIGYSTISDSEDFKGHEKHEKKFHHQEAIEEFNNGSQPIPLRPLTNVLNFVGREKETVSKKKTTLLVYSQFF